jgi:hypothetical protein
MEQYADEMKLCIKMKNTVVCHQEIGTTELYQEFD